jgi:hypothetical protein
MSFEGKTIGLLENGKLNAVECWASWPRCSRRGTLAQ